jgi:ribosome-associated translation inhibitor RaiA
MAVLGKITANMAPISANVEAGRISRHHRSGNIFRVEIMVRAKGLDLRAEALGKTVLEAMDKAQDEMRTELERAKGQRADAVKAGGRAIKRIIKGA